MELHERVSTVEAQMAEHGVRLKHVEGTTDEIRSMVRTLLDRAAQRGEPLSWRGIAGAVVTTCAVLMGIGGLVSWAISVSPVVLAHEERLTILDHEVVGRVPRLERRVNRAESWATSIEKAK